MGLRFLADLRLQIFDELIRTKKYQIAIMGGMVNLDAEEAAELY